MVGFYLGWIITFIIFSSQNKLFQQLISGIYNIITGICTITIPIILYFLSNSALSDLYSAYFYNNLFHYAFTQISIFKKLSWGIESLWKFNRPTSIIRFLGIIWALDRGHWKQAFFIATTLFTTFLFVYGGGRSYVYYGFIFNSFIVFGLCWFLSLLSSTVVIKTKIKKILPNCHYLSISIGMISLCIFSMNISFMDYPKEFMMQYKMKTVIDQSSLDNPTILEYKTMATGINTVAGLMPNTRYFCSFNLLEANEMIQEQNECVRNTCADFIITESDQENDQTSFENYYPIDTYQGSIHNDNRNHYYTLYRRK